MGESPNGTLNTSPSQRARGANLALEGSAGAGRRAYADLAGDVSGSNGSAEVSDSRASAPSDAVRIPGLASIPMTTRQHATPCTVCNGVQCTVCNGVQCTVCNGVQCPVCNGVQCTVSSVQLRSQVSSLSSQL